jgi:hypothetical protein
MFIFSSHRLSKNSYKQKRFLLAFSECVGGNGSLIYLVSTCDDVDYRCATTTAYCTCLCHSCCCNFHRNIPSRNIVPCRRPSRSLFACCRHWNIVLVTCLDNRASVTSCCIFYRCAERKISFTFHRCHSKCPTYRFLLFLS